MTTEEEYLEAAFERLSRELRFERKRLEVLYLELYNQDLHLMSLPGALKHLSKKSRKLDEIKALLERSTKNPEYAPKLLERIEKIIDD